MDLIYINFLDVMDDLNMMDADKKITEFGLLDLALRGI